MLGIERIPQKLRSIRSETTRSIAAHVLYTATIFGAAASFHQGWVVIDSLERVFDRELPIGNLPYIQSLEERAAIGSKNQEVYINFLKSLGIQAMELSLTGGAAFLAWRTR